MKKELYQCSVINEERSQNIYFDTFDEAREYAHEHDVRTITRIAGDMERVDVYEWKSQEREIKVIQQVWDWYSIEKETQHEEISRIQIIGHPVQ